MVGKRAQRARERDPLAELSRLIARADTHEESAPADDRCGLEAGPECFNDPTELPPAPQLVVDQNELGPAYEQDGRWPDDIEHSVDDAEEEYQDIDPRSIAEGFRETFAIEEQHQDNEVLRARRRSLTLVMAVLGLVLIGSACAVGYRNTFGGSISSTLAPTIQATDETNPLQTVSDGGPVNTGSIDNTKSRKDQPNAFGNSKAAPDASALLTTVPATPNAGAAAPMVPPATVTAPAHRLTTAASALSRPGQSHDANDTIASSRERLAAVAVAHANSDTNGAVTATVVARGYAVQVTSERSESRAQTAFRALRAKYPNQLGGHEPMIRRADLGAAGIYYRALIGPFASAEQATKLCRGLKAAGGDCLIQKNP